MHACMHARLAATAVENTFTTIACAKTDKSSLHGGDRFLLWRRFTYRQKTDSYRLPRQAVTQKPALFTVNLLAVRGSFMVNSSQPRQTAVCSLPFDRHHHVGVVYIVCGVRYNITFVSSRCPA